MAIGTVNAFMSAAQGIASWNDDSESVRQAKMAQSNLEIEQQALGVQGAIKSVGASLLFDKAKTKLAINQSAINRDREKLREQSNLRTERLARIRATTIKGPTGEGSTMSGKNNELMLLSQAAAEQIKLRENRENFAAAHKAAMNQFQSDWDTAKSSEDQGVTAKAGFTGYNQNPLMKGLSIGMNVAEGLGGLGAFGKKKGDKGNRSFFDFLSGNKDREPGTGWKIFT